MSASDILLEAKGLSAGYGAAQILHDLNLQVRRGEVVALMGRNGAGKSTTLKALIGLVARRHGQVSFMGHDLTPLEPHHAARWGLGYVPEDRRIFTDLTVLQNLQVGQQKARQWPDGTPAPHWTVDAVFELFPNLGEMPQRPGGQMSGGEQQMLSIGRALMTHPDLIVLDEATEGLAPLIVNEIWNVITNIRDSGIATLIVDRDYRRVLAHSDQAIVLQKGLVALAGPSSQVAVDNTLPKLLGV